VALTAPAAQTLHDVEERAALELRKGHAQCNRLDAAYRLTPIQIGLQCK